MCWNRICYISEKQKIIHFQVFQNVQRMSKMNVFKKSLQELMQIGTVDVNELFYEMHFYCTSCFFLGLLFCASYTLIISIICCIILTNNDIFYCITYNLIQLDNKTFNFHISFIKSENSLSACVGFISSNHIRTFKHGLKNVFWHSSARMLCPSGIFCIFKKMLDLCMFWCACINISLILLIVFTM